MPTSKYDHQRIASRCFLQRGRRIRYSTQITHLAEGLGWRLGLAVARSGRGILLGSGRDAVQHLADIHHLRSLSDMHLGVIRTGKL